MYCILRVFYGKGKQGLTNPETVKILHCKEDI